MPSKRALKPFTAALVAFVVATIGLISFWWFILWLIAKGLNNG